MENGKRLKSVIKKMKNKKIKICLTVTDILITPDGVVLEIEGKEKIPMNEKLREKVYKNLKGNSHG